MAYTFWSYLLTVTVHSDGYVAPIVFVCKLWKWFTLSLLTWQISLLQNPCNGCRIWQKTSWLVQLRSYYRPQRSCGQGNIFTPVCHSFCSQGGSASVHAGIPPCPPVPGRHPPDQADTPPGPGRHPPQTRPPGPERHPPGPGRHPPDQAYIPPPLDQADPPGTKQTPLPPPRKQTPAYDLRAAGTHPNGMHSYLNLFTVIVNQRWMLYNLNRDGHGQRVRSTTDNLVWFTTPKGEKR